MKLEKIGYRKSWKLTGCALVCSAFVLASCAKKQAETSAVDTTATAPASQNIAVIPDSVHPAYPNVKLMIVSPREGQVLKDPKDSVRVVLQVSGFDLGRATEGDAASGTAYSKQGQHVHIIVDDKPYMADYQNGQPFNVGVLPPGMHSIRAFPSFSWHESIKSPGAFATRTFYVGSAPKSAKAAPANNLGGPLLTYSRPKGTYAANEASKVLLDFYVTNAKLGPNDYKVNVSVDGKQMAPITEWQPYFITGLQPGKHSVKLQLMDPTGKPVPGDFNSPTGEFTITK